jgi:ribonuclease VapC
LEAGIVIETRKGESEGRELDLLLHRINVEVIPLIAELTQLAQEAWHKFGKGRHPAKLNIGGCCSYALAKYSGEPLLFK